MKVLILSSYKTKSWLEKIKKRINPEIRYRESLYYIIFTTDKDYDKGICQLHMMKNKIRMFTIIPKSKEIDKEIIKKCRVILRSVPTHWRYSKQYPTQFDINDESDIDGAICLINLAYLIRDV